MTSIQLLTGPVVEALGWALLHLVWQGALVAGILAATLALLSRRSSNARYAAACIALATLPILATITAVRSYEAPRQPVAMKAMPVTIEPVIAVIPLVQPQAAVAIQEPSRFETILSTAQTYFPIAVLAWLCGVVLLATRLMISWVRVQRMARERARAAASVWSASVTRLSRLLGLRRAVRLLESAAVEVPTVIGWLRPVILLPASTLAGLSPEQIEMLLAHELAHIRRHDFFINLLQALVETLMFYHPAVWWISQRVRVERENCCDDLAVGVCGNVVQYARALTRLEELRAGVDYAAVAANGGSLVERIRRLIASPREATAGAPRWAAGAAVLTLIIAVVALPSLPLFAKREESKKPAPQEQSAVNPPSSQVDVDATSDNEPDAEAGSEAPDAEADADSDVDADVDTDADTDVEGVDVAVPEVPEAPPAPPAPAGRPAPAPRAVPLPRIAGMSAMATVAPHIAQAVKDGVEGALNDIDIDVDIDTDFDEADAKKFGASGKLTVDELISLRANGVTPEYIDQMRNASLGELTLGQILAMRVQGVTPEYVRDLRNAGIDVRDAKEVIAMRVQGVSADYVQKMRAAGYQNVSVKELVGMRVQGVTPDFVQQMASSGYRNLTPRELIQLRVMGVTPAFIKALGEAGYTNLSVKDIVRLAASGVNADFIRQMSQYRDKK